MIYVDDANRLTFPETRYYHTRKYDRVFGEVTWADIRFRGHPFKAATDGSMGEIEDMGSESEGWGDLDTTTPHIRLRR